MDTRTLFRCAMRLLLLGLMLCAGDAGAEEEGKTLSPYFFVDGDSASDQSFPLERTDVTATINGVIADVIVRQTYHNGGAQVINARYVFPASSRAAVHAMRTRIGERMVVAKIKEKQQAAQEYKAAQAAGKTAALLEQERPNVFTMAIANIMPGDEVVVELEYSELLVPSGGVYEFVFPTVVGPRYSHTLEADASADDAWVASPYLHEDQAPTSEFAMQVDLVPGLAVSDVRSTSHPIKVEWDNLSTAHIRSDGRSGNRDFILDYRLDGNRIESGVLLNQAPSTGGENFFTVMVEPPRRVPLAQIVPREYIFVLDVSGSMHGFPLETAKTLIHDLIGSLRPSDAFNVVLFSGASRLLAKTSLPANADNIALALRAIDNERGGGGTELAGALRIAAGVPEDERYSRTIAVITDGFICEEPEALATIRGNLQRTNYFAFGIGSSVNRYLIEGIAHAGQGEPFVVTKPAEAAQVANRFREYIDSPVLTDIHVRYDGFDAYDVEPAVQPDLFAERPLVITGKWRGARKGDIEITGRTASGDYAQTLHVANAPSGSGNAALAQLWARTRIARLSDFNYLAADPEAVREVTSLGLTYSLLTKYTSFIAVFEQVRNFGAPGETVQQPLPLPEGVSDLAVGSGAEPEAWVLALCVLFGLAFVTWSRRIAVRA